MKITKQEDYAILFMSILAAQPNKKLSLQEVADDSDIPYYFLKKIAGQLKEAGLVKAKEGAAGGYSLGLPAKEINLAEIIEAVRGPLALVDCANGGFCPPEDYSKVTTVMKSVSRQVRDLFAKVRLTDMVNK